MKNEHEDVGKAEHSWSPGALFNILPRRQAGSVGSVESLAVMMAAMDVATISPAAACLQMVKYCILYDSGVLATSSDGLQPTSFLLLVVMYYTD